MMAKAAAPSGTPKEDSSSESWEGQMEKESQSLKEKVKQLEDTIMKMGLKIDNVVGANVETQVQMTALKVSVEAQMQAKVTEFETTKDQVWHQGENAKEARKDVQKMKITLAGVLDRCKALEKTQGKQEAEAANQRAEITKLQALVKRLEKLRESDKLALKEAQVTAREQTVIQKEMRLSKALAKAPSQSSGAEETRTAEEMKTTPWQVRRSSKETSYWEEEEVNPRWKRKRSDWEEDPIEKETSYWEEEEMHPRWKRKRNDWEDDQIEW